MREAIGGSILFYIILVFLAVYIIFIGVIMNYAATYRASNYVLTRLEETEGEVPLGSKNDNKDAGTLYGDLRTMNYYNDLDVTCSENTNGAVYKITTYVNFNVPLLGVNLKLRINNETKTIYGVKCNPSYNS